jgi:epoxyqueuosine reductase QueG
MGFGMDKELLRELIAAKVNQMPGNGFHPLRLPEEPMWEAPLIGIASGIDPYFAFFKQDIGESYWTPAEAFSLGYPNVRVTDEELTVISLVFPQTALTKADQRRETLEPSLRWVTARGMWETYMKNVCHGIEDALASLGMDAVAIDLLPELSRFTSERYGMTAKWSHRHAAFVAGLGTFGLSDGLITRKGKAMRCTTILAKTVVAPDQRPYGFHTDWCSFYANGTCGICIDRCPAGAITKEGHDKELCNAYEDSLRDAMVLSGKMDPAYIGSCGLCQCGVPCEHKVPVSQL